MNVTSLTFVVFFYLILLFDGLGLPYGRIVSYYLILIFPFIFIIHDLVKKRKITFPKKITFAFISFYIFYLISQFRSVNFYNSIFDTLLYGILFLCFIVIFNHKEEITKILPKHIFFLSAIFIVYFLLIRFFFFDNLPILIPFHGYQLVYSKFGHNHLGDFLLLPTIISFYSYFKLKSKKYLFGFLFFILFLLISYSRSAYLDLIIILFLSFKRFQDKKLKVIKLVILSIVIIFSILFFATTEEYKNAPFLSHINQFLTDNVMLKEKYFYATRLVFFEEAIKSFQERPIFGVGPNNFVYASMKYSSSNNWTFSSHNFFLDILVENGVLAFIAFLLLIFQFFKNIFAQKSLWGLTALAILLNFQTDYTFDIYSFIFLFFIILGLGYSKNETKQT